MSRSLCTITPAETLRLLRLYVDRSKAEDVTVFGLFDGPDLVYWTLNKRDANKKGERWGGLKTEVVAKTRKALLAFLGETS